MLYFLVLLCGVYIGGCICSYLEVWLTNVKTDHHPIFICLSWPFSLLAILALDSDKDAIREKLGWAPVPDQAQANEVIRMGKKLDREYRELFERFMKITAQCGALSQANLMLFNMLACSECYARIPCEYCLVRMGKISECMDAAGFLKTTTSPPQTESPPESP